DAEIMAKAEAAGYVGRVFQHRVKGEIRMILICGRPGPVSLHTPDVCFPGAGLSLDAEPERAKVALKDTSDAQFMAARLRGSGPARQMIKVHWSFTDGSGWKAPDNPRVAFGRADILYKLYIVRELEKPDESVKHDPALDFLQALLPKMKNYLS